MFRNIALTVAISLMIINETYSFRKLWWYKEYIPSNGDEYGYYDYHAMLTKNNNPGAPYRFGPQNTLYQVYGSTINTNGGYEFYNNNADFPTPVASPDFLPNDNVNSWKRHFYIDNTGSTHINNRPWVIYDISYKCHCEDCKYACKTAETCGASAVYNDWYTTNRKDCIPVPETEIIGRQMLFSCSSSALDFFNNNEDIKLGGSGPYPTSLKVVKLTQTVGSKTPGLYSGCDADGNNCQQLLGQDLDDLFKTPSDTEIPSCPKFCEPCCVSGKRN